MTKLAGPYLHVLYCDDIRQEIGGKITFVGVYNAFLGVEEAPVVLPKLSIHVSFVVPADQTVEGLKFRLIRDDAEVAAFDSPPLELPIPKDDMPITRRSYSLNIGIAPFPIEGPSILRVIAESNLGTFTSGGLRITVGKSLNSPVADGG
ncbi:DUF6941 family protein [Paraburkholderia graminis]|uniref:DUF6941 family protein n=1 Tax=Paraburkholderia graminis TaxID=60548 RepID=UPI003C901154